MEVYILDSMLRRTEVVDGFDSMIWTERYASWGDFEIHINSTPKTRAQFVTDTHLAMNESYRVMIVESVENKTDVGGLQKLTVKGRSIESILDDRVAKDAFAPETSDSAWLLNGTGADIVREVFNQICVLGLLDTRDIIPFITAGSIFPPSTLPEPTRMLNYKMKLDTLYNAMKTILDFYNLGFRLVRNFDHSELYFDVYSGDDRTTRQTEKPPVVFSPELDNLQSTTTLTTSDNYKNVAYVFSPAGSMEVIPDDVDAEADGFERRILLVDASDITNDDHTLSAPTIEDELIARGLRELSKQRRFFGIDGEINDYANYRYGIDYMLGDLVETHDEDDFMTIVRVTEQIFVSDTEGDRSYPTLTQIM